MTITRRDADSHADEVLPLDGPYDPEALNVAAGLITELVRRLNHASQWHNSDHSLPYPSSVDRQVACLSGTVNSLPQLLKQLAQRLDTISPDQRLRVDNMGVQINPSETASTAAYYLRSAATLLAEVQTELSEARRNTSRLSWHNEEEDLT